MCGREGHTGATSHGRCRPLRIETVEEAWQKTGAGVCMRGPVCVQMRVPLPPCVTTELDTWRRDDKGTRAGRDVGTQM